MARKSHEPAQSGSGLSFLEAMDPADDFGHRFTGAFRVVVGLKVDPALRVSAKVRAQAQCRVDRDAAQTLHDLVDAPGWDVNGTCQSILADTQGLEPVFQQDGAGVGERNLARHLRTPSVVIDDLDLLCMPFGPYEAKPPLAADPDAVLALSIMLQRLELIARRNPEEVQGCGGMQLLQLPESDSLDVHKAFHPQSFKQGLRIPATKTQDHGDILTASVINRKSLRFIRLPALHSEHSPFGRMLQAIRENDFRTEALGFHTGRRARASRRAHALPLVAVAGRALRAVGLPLPHGRGGAVAGETVRPGIGVFNAFDGLILRLGLQPVAQ